jgi:hypothetical protein
MAGGIARVLQPRLPEANIMSSEVAHFTAPLQSCAGEPSPMLGPILYRHTSTKKLSAGSASTAIFWLKIQ